MDNTSYVIEVNHHYDGSGGNGDNIRTRPRKAVNMPTVESITKNINDRELQSQKAFFKQQALIAGAAAYSAVKVAGEYTGDYGTSRGVKNAIKGIGFAASLSNPYTAAMSMIGVSSSIATSFIKKRNHDYQAERLKQISGGLNNGYRGRKL